jgi:hypothetical protein
MRPKFQKRNMKKAFSHPTLFFHWLQGYDNEELSKEHVKLHLNKVTRLKPNPTGQSLVDLVCQAVDQCSNYCYHTQYLYMIAKLLKPQKFVETGVHYGASSAFILKGLEGTDGKLYSIDLPNVEYAKDKGGTHVDYLPPSAKTGLTVPTSLRANWDLRLGDSKQELPKLFKSIGMIDCFHHDSCHTYDFMTFEFEIALKYLKPGGLLLSDDVTWNNAFTNFCLRHSLENRINKEVGIAIKPK